MLITLGNLLRRVSIVWNWKRYVDDIVDIIESNIHLFISKCYCWTFDFVSNGSFFNKDFAEGFSDKSIDLDLALCNKVIEVLLGRGFKIEETCRNQSSYVITISV
jgi:hypothetical protein